MEQLLLVNPRRRRRRSRRKSAGRRRQPAALARYWATHRRGRRRVAATNPRRRRRRAHVRYHARRQRGFATNPRRRRRNPRSMAGMGRGILGKVKGSAVPALYGAGGALALDVVMGYASPYLPASLQAGWFNVGVKALGAVGVGMVVGKVLGADKGRIATIGGMTVVAYGALKSLVKSAVPTLPGLSGYSDYTAYPVRMGAYMPGPTGTPGIRGLGYVSPAPTLSPRMGAYMPRMPMNVAPTMGDYGDGM